MFLIKSSMILSFLFIIYIVLQNDKNIKRNRYYLLTGILFSIAIPFVKFSLNSPIANEFTIELSPIIINANETITSNNFKIDFSEVFWMIYGLGVLFFLGKYIFQFFKLLLFLRKKEYSKIGKIKIYQIDEKLSPFSFLNMIFINKNISDADANIILVHEQAHIKQKHYIDLILMEIIAIIQWFNPIVWYYRKSLKEIHEYQADQIVLKNGVEKLRYVQLLLAMALNVSLSEITNNFCQTKLKRRLKMITKIKNAKFANIKFYAALTFSLMFVWFVNTNISAKITHINSEDIKVGASINSDKDSVFMVVEDMPSFVGGEEARVKFLQKNLVFPKAQKEKKQEGTVFATFIVEKDGSMTDIKIMKGVNNDFDNEVLRVVKLMPKWKPGKQKGKTVRVSYVMPFKFVLDK